MNQASIAELRRRLNPDKRNPSILRGLYISAQGKVLSDFALSVARLSQDDCEKYMVLFRKVLTGTFGQNLIETDFSAEETMESESHERLMRLVSSGLTDEDSVQSFYGDILKYVEEIKDSRAQSVSEEQKADNYLVLMLYDSFDVKYRTTDDSLSQELSEEVFGYMLCCVCPVKQEKPSLHYDGDDDAFHVRAADWAASAPELGFLFPAYEDGGANISRLVYYTRDKAKMHDSFRSNVLHVEQRMSPAEQQETFQAVLQESLGEDCSLETVQAMQDTLNEKIKEQKSDKSANPLTLTGHEVGQVLADCGVAQPRVEAFESLYTETFGEQAQIPAVNMVSTGAMKVETPSVSIRVAPEHANLIETRVIDGRYYILVLADGDVEVNGMRVNG